MARIAEKVFWTIRDIPLLPQNDSVNYEIIDRELFVTRSPHHLHQRVCGKLFRYLDEWSESSGLGETIIAPVVILSDIDSVIPDVVWISQERLAQVEDKAGHLLSAPELVIEVLPPGKNNEDRNKEAKLKLYSLHGVSEYWICDRLSKQVAIYSRKNARLILVTTLLENDIITFSLLPNFSCLVSQLFVL
ncbi:Uma2 family endonuclease [Myxosarcina sp. GI1]|uniref:Uma2 family endonuclease n=1 Tax=Myxosarcina sp. GI1 TaxID=1541065 RepID=UPI00056BD0FB|nr:Uma2 family endonuclease [Myxosarcina sp. GI1]